MGAGVWGDQVPKIFSEKQIFAGFRCGGGGFFQFSFAYLLRVLDMILVWMMGGVFFSFFLVCITISNVNNKKYKVIEICSHNYS